MSTIKTSQHGFQPFDWVVRGARLGLIQIATAWSARSTPARFRAAQIIGVAGAMAVGWAAWHAYSELRTAVQTLGRDTVPSIVAALHIRANLADANANAVNAFLLNEGGDGKYWMACRKEMDDVHADLVTASQNITYGDEERVPIVAIMTTLGAYEQLVGVARGRQGSQIYEPMLKADQLVHDKILHACNELAQANSTHLTQIYRAYVGQSFKTFLPAVILVLVLAGLFAWIQWDLFHTTRRIVNPGVAVASLALIAFAFHGTRTFLSGREDLIMAKKDAFDSIYALWEARAVAYEANAEESLYLLENGRSAGQAARTGAFHSKTALLYSADSKDAAAGTRQHPTGYLADELANITFEGELEAARNLLAAWKDYCAIDTKIRTLEQQGRYQDALELNVGLNPGQSNYAFALFDKCLDETLAINQKQFDAAIDRDFSRLNPFPYILVSSILLICCCTYAGIKPRLDEYRF